MAWILLIEDDTRMRSVLRDALTLVGYQVIEAAMEHEGLAHVRAQPPDLAIVDLFLPGQNGVEFIRTLQWAAPQLPILAISGGSPELPYDFLRIAEGLGARRALRKPFTLQALYAAVEELLQAAGARDP